MATGEIGRMIVGHSLWAGLVLMLAVLFARSRPGHELGRVVSIEIRWRYLKWKGVSDDELQQLLRDGWNDEDPRPEPPATV